MINDKEIKHPAYVMVGFNRVDGSSGNLFGSSIECDRFIELVVRPGMEVEAGTYHAFQEASMRPMMRIKLSPNQYAELLTTMNVSSGVPGTLVSFNGQEIEKIPDEIHENELDRQKRVFKESMTELKDRINGYKERVKELCDKPKLGKADREELLKVIDNALSRIENDFPHYEHLFQEGTDNIVMQAKAEIDATVQHCLIKTGLTALGQKFENKNGIELKE